jgi:hypothetical protein
MGAYSPPLWMDEAIEPYIHENITEAAVQAMMQEGLPYKGVLYPGIMVTPEGPKVLEFNCRFGDPETQVLLPRLKSDLLEICWAVANGTLADAEVEWSTDACVGVVMASGGYPDEYETGFEIAGLKSVDDGVLVFHAGTTNGDDGQVLTAGGRVLTVVATAPTLQDARAKAYRTSSIHFTRALPPGHRGAFAGCADRMKVRVRISAVMSTTSAAAILPSPAHGRGDRVRALPRSHPHRLQTMSLLDPCIETLKQLGIEHELHVMSAHRSPQKVQAFASAAADHGFEVIIAAAGMAAHLPASSPPGRGCR